MYKQAAKIKLRIPTNVGDLSAEQLYDLKESQIANAIKQVKKALKKDNDDELSFLEDSNVIDVENQLRFDILKDVYLTKKKEREEQVSEFEKKQHNQKILELIKEKQENNLKDKSIEELEKLIK